MISNTAIILAAGKGTRMKSDLPKVLHPVCGRPMLKYVVDACRQAGCQRLLVVVGHQEQLVKQAFAADSQDITYVTQSPQLGTGHAVMVCCEELAKLSGPVLVVAGDGPLIRPQTLRQLIQTHQKENAACTLATCMLQDPGKYGRIVREADGALAGIVEHLEATEAQRQIKEVNVSLYCFEAEALNSVLGRLKNDNAKGEYYLTDALAILKADGKRLSAVAAVPPEDVVSINTLDELAQVDRIMARRMGGSSSCACCGGCQ